MTSNDAANATAEAPPAGRAAVPEVHDFLEDLLLGKFLPVLVFLFFTVASFFYLVEKATLLLNAPAPTPILVLPVVHSVLNFPFFLLQTWLFLVRGKPVARTERPGERAIAFVGAFAMMFLPAVRGPMTGSVPLLSAAVALELVGGALTILSLSHLRRHFSIIPEARGIVRSGPYALVRHPMYLSEIVWCAGIILPILSPGVLLLYCLMISFLFLRAAFEERLLEATFPAYADYRKGTWRIVPFLGKKG